MASKLSNNEGKGGLKSAQDSIYPTITKSSMEERKKNEGLDPLLMPEKIKQLNTKYIHAEPIDLLDMKSKKTIDTIGRKTQNLASINPLEEGGFGMDHPAVKTKGSSKKNLKPFPEAEVIENIDAYEAVLLDLKSVMKKLAANRKEIFSVLSQK